MFCAVLLQVMEAEQSRTHSELAHRETAAKYNAAISHMRQLEKKLKRTISKSRLVNQLRLTLKCNTEKWDSNSTAQKLYK